MKLARHVLRVRDPAPAARFYRALGMQQLSAADEPDDEVALRFPGEAEPCTLVLRTDTAAQPPGDEKRRPGYWKIGLTTPNVDALRARILALGVDVSQPAQFEDVGYVCHLRDPAGFAVELLQHRFGAARSDAPVDPVRLGQVTLRVRNASASLSFYEGLGMRLLSRQPVPRHRFTLYFLAFTEESPPCADLDAVENREWLWQRETTLLELQHAWDADPSAHEAREAGAFCGLVVCGKDLPEARVLTDPDGNRVDFVPGATS